MRHSGIGQTQANNFLTSLNLPYVSSTLVQNRSEEVSETMQSIASASAHSALTLEMELTGSNDHSTKPITSSEIYQRLGMDHNLDKIN